MNQNWDNEGSTSLIEKSKSKLKKPSMYSVLLLNDDFTPRAFVVEILRIHYQKSEEQAVKIMMTAHRSGQSLVGVYSYEVAETKVKKTNLISKEQKFPLRFSMEPST